MKQTQVMLTIESLSYNMIAGVGVQTWSKCGGSTAILNVNSEIRITPQNTPSNGFMTVRSNTSLSPDGSYNKID